MTFGNIAGLPTVIALGITLIAVTALYAFLRRRSYRKLFGVQSRGIFVRILISEILILLAIIAGGLTIARPQWGERQRLARSRGIDLIVVMDVSRSMLAADVGMSRLERARTAVKLLSGEIGGARKALIVFAGESFLLCPLTDDADAFEAFLDSASSGSVGVQGTDIGEALATAGKVIARKDLRDKYVLVISDGEDHEGGAEKAAGELATQGVTVFSFSVGTEAGDVVKMSEEDTSGLRDDDGKIVVSRARFRTLKSIAAETGGLYEDISSGFAGVYQVAARIRSLSGSERGGRMVTEPVERYQIFALILFVLLLAEMVVWKIRK